jgi:hypothetical protein
VEGSEFVESLVGVDACGVPALTAGSSDTAHLAALFNDVVTLERGSARRVIP